MLRSRERDHLHLLNMLEAAQLQRLIELEDGRRK